jgi:Phytanoyl-CoA dioxygenase (PhyH)
MSGNEEEVSEASLTEKSLLGVAHLKCLWFRATSTSMGHTLEKHQPGEWLRDKIVIHGLGLGLEETFQYLGQNAPTYEQFEHWILKTLGGSLEPARIERINAAIDGTDYSEKQKEAIRELERSEPVLTTEDLAFWHANGYLVVHNAISVEECRAAEQAIREFLDIDPDDADTWYKRRGSHGIMAQFFHHPALESNRRSRRIHKAFAQIWNDADLWVSVDRVSFNPPERKDWKFPGPHLHWDTTLALPIPFDVSGLLYLTDTSAEQGAFTCVPGFHRRIADWLKDLPPGTDPRTQDLEQLGAVPIAGQAGDLIIWHRALPHGSRPNHAHRPRFVQYITMYPTRMESNPIWR